MFQVNWHTRELIGKSGIEAWGFMAAKTDPHLEEPFLFQG